VQQASFELVDQRDSGPRRALAAITAFGRNRGSEESRDSRDDEKRGLRRCSCGTTGVLWQSDEHDSVASRPWPETVRGKTRELEPGEAAWNDQVTRSEAFARRHRHPAWTGCSILTWLRQRGRIPLPLRRPGGSVPVRARPGRTAVKARGPIRSLTVADVASDLAVERKARSPSPYQRGIRAKETFVYVNRHPRKVQSLWVCGVLHLPNADPLGRSATAAAPETTDEATQEPDGPGSPSSCLFLRAARSFAAAHPNTTRPNTSRNDINFSVFPPRNNGSGVNVSHCRLHEMPSRMRP
jgi:hypothetical protein